MPVGSEVGGLYDCAEGFHDLEDDAVADARPGYRQVADTLRDRILSGHYPPGRPIDGQLKVSGELGADIAVVQRAYTLLDQEGFLRVGSQGVRTIVLDRRPYEATVTLPRRGEPRPGEPDELRAAATAAAEAFPVITEVRTAVEGNRATVWVTAVTADPARAVLVAFEVARAAAGDRWDLAAAQTSSVPAS